MEKKPKKKFLKKGAALVLSTAMMLGMVPALGKPLTVQAEETEVKNVNLNIGGTIAGIGNPEIATSYTSPWTGAYVYFGTYNGSPVKYRVLDPNTTDFNSSGTMFLDCDTILWYGAFDSVNGTQWAESSIRKYLNNYEGYEDTGFLTTFTQGEQNAIAESTNASHLEWSGEIRESYNGMQVENYTELTGEKIFLLDVKEILHEEYGYYGTDVSVIFTGGQNKRKSGSSDSVYWLRTEISDASGNYMSCIYEEGVFALDASTMGGVSPALNVDLSSVLFTSASDADKSAVFDLTTAQETNDTWKLTIQDGTGFAAARKAEEEGDWVEPGGTLHVDISALPGDAVSTYTQTSAMLVDGSGTVVAYGKIADGAAAGEIGVTIPGTVAEGNYTLKVFAETVNSSASANFTDYASNMADIPIRVGYHTHSFGTEWKYDSDNHWHECDCGKKADTAAHIEDGGTVTTEPTEDSTGVRTYKCSVCGYVMRTEEIPKLEQSQTKDTYTITYDANGGSGTMEEETATEGVAFTLAKNGFQAPKGKQFKEWAIGSVDGTRVSEGGTYTFTSATTVYAIWEDEKNSTGGNEPETPEEGQNPGTSTEPASPQDPPGTSTEPASLQDSPGASGDSASSQNPTATPKTGESMPVIWFVLMLISGSGVAGILCYRKKHISNS